MLVDYVVVMTMRACMRNNMFPSHAVESSGREMWQLRSVSMKTLN